MFQTAIEVSSRWPCRGFAVGFEARGDLGGGRRGEQKPALRNQLWQKQVKLALNTLCWTKCQLAFIQAQVAGRDVVDRASWGGAKEGQPCCCCHGRAGLLFWWPQWKYFQKSSDHYWCFTVFYISGGYCTGDNYRDERPIDVFVLNTSNYRWTEVVRKHL